MCLKNIWLFKAGKRMMHHSMKMNEFILSDENNYQNEAINDTHINCKMRYYPFLMKYYIVKDIEKDKRFI